jgi:arginase
MHQSALATQLKLKHTLAHIHTRIHTCMHNIIKFIIQHNFAGASKRGADTGPAALREAGLIDEIKQISSNIDVKDYGDVHYELMSSNGRKIHNLKELDHVAACNRALADKVEEILSDGRMPITLGGCHSIAIGSISGVVRKTAPDDLCILWVDAHLDLNTNTTSPSGKKTDAFSLSLSLSL